MPKDAMTFEIKWQGKEMKLYFENLAIKNPLWTKDDKNMYFTTNGIALVK
jgi:hypothetical protein